MSGSWSERWTGSWSWTRTSCGCQMQKHLAILPMGRSLRPWTRPQELFSQEKMAETEELFSQEKSAELEELEELEGRLLSIGWRSKEELFSQELEGRRLSIGWRSTSSPC